MSNLTCCVCFVTSKYIACKFKTFACVTLPVICTVCSSDFNLDWLKYFKWLILYSYLLLHFVQNGTSKDPCSTTYGGPSVQSELEVQAITAYIHTNKPIYGAIDFHSYGQYILYPHGS